mmetsp:Transcript_3431/g.9873  ORF Transcript_3431/g.9873 Transcript_3431/m.9873 type:complete len:277 (+) Transcript_3431:901-1731(+)
MVANCLGQLCMQLLALRRLFVRAQLCQEVLVTGVEGHDLPHVAPGAGAAHVRHRDELAVVHNVDASRALADEVHPEGLALKERRRRLRPELAAQAQAPPLRQRGALFARVGDEHLRRADDQHHLVAEAAEGPRLQPDARFAQASSGELFRHQGINGGEEAVVATVRRRHRREAAVPHSEREQLQQRELPKVRLGGAHIVLRGALQLDLLAQQAPQERGLDDDRCACASLRQLVNRIFALLPEASLEQVRLGDLDDLRLGDLRQLPRDLHAAHGAVR